MTDLAYSQTLDPREEPGGFPPTLVALVGAFVVPILAATGLSLPLPSIVYRVAVDIATLAESLVAGATGHDLGRDAEDRAATGRIVLTVREQRAQSANRIVIIPAAPKPGTAVASSPSKRVGRARPMAPRSTADATTAPSPETSTPRAGATAVPTHATSVGTTTTSPATELSRTQPLPEPTTDPVPAPKPDSPRIVEDAKAPLTDAVRSVTTEPVDTVTTIVSPVVSDPVDTVTTTVAPVVAGPVGTVTQAASPVVREPLTTVIPTLPPSLPKLP